GGQRRPYERQRDVPVDAELGGAVHTRGVYQVATDGRGNVLTHEEDAEGAGHAGKPQRPRGIQPAEEVDNQVVGDDVEQLREGQGGDEEAEQHVAALELVNGEPEPCQGAEEERGDGGQRRHVHAVPD